MKNNKISGIISKLILNVDNTKNLYVIFDHYGVCYSTKNMLIMVMTQHTKFAEADLWVTEIWQVCLTQDWV
jgi:hypothetical protein